MPTETTTQPGGMVVMLDAPATQTASMSAEDRAYWLDKRQALLIELRAVERRLGMALSVPPRREPKKPGY